MMSFQSTAVLIRLCYLITLTSVINIVCRMQAQGSISELPLFLTRNLTPHFGSQGSKCLGEDQEPEYSSVLNSRDAMTISR